MVEAQFSFRVSTVSLSEAKVFFFSPIYGSARVEPNVLFTSFTPHTLSLDAKSLHQLIVFITADSSLNSIFVFQTFFLLQAAHVRRSRKLYRPANPKREEKEEKVGALLGLARILLCHW
jgi:hypothetical protein